MFYVSSFSPIASNPVGYLLWTLSLCFQAEPSTLLLLCSHTLAMFLSNPLIIHVFAFLHTLKHMPYTVSTLGAEEMEPPLRRRRGELRTWLSSSSTLYICHQGVLVIAKVPTGVLWITLILCVYHVEETEHIFQLGKSCSVSYERTNYKRPQIKNK